MNLIGRRLTSGAVSSLALLALASPLACSGDAAKAPAVTQDELTRRAYIISRDSDELTVIDLDDLEIIARVPTGGRLNHMAELNADFSKIYVDSSGTDESIVIDAAALEITHRLPLGHHPTHLSLSRDGELLAVMNEDDDSVSFVDPATDTEIKRLPGFYTPHFMRFSADGKYGYVANIGAHHLTRVDLETLEIVDHIALDGFEGPPNATPAVDETGFADAQIDSTGVLYAAHAGTARVLAYDTVSQKKLGEIAVGIRPWVVFAEHPFTNVPLRHLVPTFGDKKISLISGELRSVMASLPGDEEAYGVNFSSRVPDTAFVMNRVRQDVAVVDTLNGTIQSRIPVGGNSETASTTPDGKFIIVTVSSANRVVVLDAEKQTVVKTFENVGVYPWSVTIPLGQNYCH